MRIVSLAEIETTLPKIDLISEIEKGFVAYSRGETVVPPVGELILDKGEVHIKYGYIKGGDHYIVKIASGFYQNPKLGIPPGNGMMLLFRQETGEPECVLLDEGYLTDVRTAVAGAIAAKYLAPKSVSCIGIVGTGVQARLQLKYLKDITSCRDVIVWGRSNEKLDQYRDSMEKEGFSLKSTQNANEILLNCDLVVTTTPSKSAILFAPALQNGIHITAVGSDTPEKRELDGAILKRADIVVADSIRQCRERGEIHHVLKEKLIDQSRIVELGQIIAGEAEGRTSEQQISVADLTGVAVQDMQIAKAVLSELEGSL